MGKKQTAAVIKGNKVKGDGNTINIQQAPPPEAATFWDMLQSKDAELKKANDLIYLLREKIGTLEIHVDSQNQEMARMRDHITKKDNYIHSLLFKQAS